MKTINLKMPTSWNDLKRWQLLYVCRLFLLSPDENKFRLMGFLKLTGVKVLPGRSAKKQSSYLFKKGRTRFSLTPEELIWFLKSVNFLATESQLVKNLIPKFRIGLRYYFGPARKCYNIRFLEFIMAEKCLFYFNTTHEIKYLNELCAILYRPQKKGYNPMDPDFDGDRREKFNDYIYQKRAKTFRLLCNHKKYAVYVFYAGCRNALITAHPKLFSSGVVSSEPVNPIDSLQSAIQSLNLGDITKNRELEQIPVWESFGQLENMIANLKKHKTT